MSIISPVIKLECSECKECWPAFFFDTGSEVCSECRDQRRIHIAKIKFYNRVSELGGRVLGKYRGKNVGIETTCKLNHRCCPTPSCIKVWGMCKICVGHDPATTEANFKARIAELGGKVLGEYKGNSVPIKCLCPNNHETSPTPTSIQQGSGMCRICTGLEPIAGEINFRTRMAELGAKILEEYQGSRIPVKCECKNGHVLQVFPGRVHSSIGICRICVGHDPATTEENFRAKIAQLGGKVLGEYKGNRIPVECRCPNGHLSSPTPSSIQQGGGMCASCGFKSEPLCREIFEELLDCSMRKLRPKWLPWKRGKCLELDGYNEEKKVAFEYQGFQHTKYHPYFHKNGPQDFEEQKERDSFKAKICFEKGIILICVPCDYSYLDPEAMRKYIKTELIKHRIL